MAASPVGRGFALQATRRAAELRARPAEADEGSFGDVLAAKLPAATVAAMRKSKGGATVTLGTDGGAVIRVGEVTYTLAMVEERQSAYDCYREDVRSRRWEDLGPIWHSLQPTRKRRADARAPVAARTGPADAEAKRQRRAKGQAAGARALGGGGAGYDDDEPEQQSASTAAGGRETQGDGVRNPVGADGVLVPWAPIASGGPRQRERPGTNASTARHNKAVNRAVLGGRGGGSGAAATAGGRGGGRGGRPRGGRTQEEKDAAKLAVRVAAAHTELQGRVDDSAAETCSALTGSRSYKQAVAKFQVKQALQAQLDGELELAAAEYAQLAEQLGSLVAQPMALGGGAAAAGGQGIETEQRRAVFQSRMVAWERDNASKVRNTLQLYETVRRELLSIKDAVRSLAEEQEAAKAPALSVPSVGDEPPLDAATAGSVESTGDRMPTLAAASAAGRARGRGRGGRGSRGPRGGRARGSKAQQQPGINRPRGAAPKGMTWDRDVGKWVKATEPAAASAPVAAAAAEPAVEVAAAGSPRSRTGAPATPKKGGGSRAWAKALSTRSPGRDDGGAGVAKDQSIDLASDMIAGVAKDQYTSFEDRNAAHQAKKAKELGQAEATKAGEAAATGAVGIRERMVAKKAAATAAKAAAESESAEPGDGVGDGAGDGATGPSIDQWNGGAGGIDMGFEVMD